MVHQQDSPPAILCRAGCGFFGNQAFDNYCSKCYRSHQRQMQVQQQAVGPSTMTSSSSSPALATAQSAATSTLAFQTENSSIGATNHSNLPSKLVSVSDPSLSSSDTAAPSEQASSSLLASPAGSAIKMPRRCAVCNKRTGLTGFECRGCSGWHCTEHRYPDKHSCSFDYKAADRDRLQRENPAVVAKKIEKI